jgi:predicted RecA/RadA family phage recombinase
MVTHEFRIAAMIFGLSIPAASAQHIAVGERSYRKPQNVNAYQSGNDSCVSLTD